MKKATMEFRNRKTGLVWTGFVPVFQERYFMTHDNTGFCIACGNDQTGCEPDARKYTCESCNEPKVYGLEELLLRGWVKE
jgi:hypothetical protein